MAVRVINNIHIPMPFFFIPKLVNPLQAFNRLGVCTSTDVMGVSVITAQFHFPLGPFLKRPHFPQ